jgi:pimeloyl-ACP methyl ester carboxylesterase
VIIGQSISGGGATIAAATAPDLIAGIIELAPFTRAQPFDLGGPIRVKRHRTGYAQMAQVIVRGRLASWKKYLDVALPVKPADWGSELARVETKLSEQAE